MPALASHQSATTTKMLLLGDSGSGKTGSLSSLVKAGYKLWVIDLDNGLDILPSLLGKDPKLLSQVNFQTLTDKMKPQGGRLIPVKATVWPRTLGMLMDWKDEAPEGYDEKTSGKWTSPSLGNINTWGPEDVLVIDSLTFLSTAALNYILMLNGRVGQAPHQSDWYQGQQLIEGLLQQLYDESVKCNVIVMAHVTYIGEDNGPQRGYPNTLGKALPPKVGRYFNSMLMARSTGQGSAAKRKIITNLSAGIDLKNTAPGKVLPEYPLETGLADYFKAVRS